MFLVNFIIVSDFTPGFRSGVHGVNQESRGRRLAGFVHSRRGVVALGGKEGRYLEPAGNQTSFAAQGLRWILSLYLSELSGGLPGAPPGLPEGIPPFASTAN